MQFESRLSSSAISEAEEAGFRRGLAEAEANYAAVEGPMAEFAAQLSLILGSPTVQASLSDEANNGIRVSLQAAEKGDFDLAIQALPSLVQLVETPKCIQAGQVFQMRASEYVDSCEAGSTLILVSFYNESADSDAILSVDGRQRGIGVGDVREIGNDCAIFFLRGITESPELTKDGQAAEMRISCR